MRANLARGASLVLTAVILSGCSSSGWTPNFAFWKSSPFQPAPGATPDKVGDPAKPSGLVATSNTTAPMSNYANPTPATVAQGTPVGYTAPSSGYPTSQNPYAAANGVGGSPYASNSYATGAASVPGAGPYGSSASGLGSGYGTPSGGLPASRGTANPYGSPPNGPYNTAAAPPSYNTPAPSAYNPTGGMPSNYPPSGVAGDRLCEPGSAGFDAPEQ